MIATVTSPSSNRLPLRFSYGLATFGAVIFAVSILSAFPVAAQEVRGEPAWPDAKADAEYAQSGAARIHITDDLLRSPEGRASLRSYLDAKASGRLTAGKGAAVTDTVGQSRDFYVQTNVLIESERTWVSLNFTLRATNDVANVWIETSLDGSFSTEQLAELEDFILSATPESSYRPDRGIIANDNEIFGLPPDIDGDGAVDILLHDIDEGEGFGCCVLGYVSSVDLNPSAPEGQGNKRDILYVDLPDGLVQGGVISIAGTIAHEYQHLIHFGYGPELTFVNEGLSEWAEVMNGFFLRTIDYLTKTGEHNTPLLDFRLDEAVAVREHDYQRSGLFTTYLADRIGWEATGGIVAAKRPGSTANAFGAEGYEVVLDEQGLSLEEVVADFHAANYINDASLDSRYGYGLSQRQTLEVQPTTHIVGAAQTSASTDVDVSGGAVHYVQWSDATQLQLDFTTAGGAETRSKTHFRIYAEHVDGTREVIEPASAVDEFFLDGDYRRVTLIVANLDVRNSGPIHYDVASEWTPSSSAFAEETVAYDDGQLLSPVYIGQPPSMRQATMFSVPDDGKLEAVLVAPIWDNQFAESGLDGGLPRDFTVYVWDDDGSGLPGEELFSREISESPSASHVGQDGLLFLSVDVSGEEGLTGNLPAAIYIGLGNAGSDENYLSIATSTSSTSEEVSFIYYPFENGPGWAPYSAVTSNGEPLLEGKVLPVRAQFIVPTADEDEMEIPSSISLRQNYPNPFNPSTRIEYTLPRTTHVRLTIYNALGQHVATLVNGVRHAGEHSSRVDASGWSSGMYFYTLETQEQNLTRQMTVLK